MRHNIYVVAAAVGLLATACSGSPHSGTSTTTSGTPIKVLTTTVSQATTTTPAGPTRAAGTDLRSLIPTPSNTNRTDGPDPVHDNGIHLHFLVAGSPTDVMSAYKTALLGMEWTSSTPAHGPRSPSKRIAGATGSQPAPALSRSCREKSEHNWAKGRSWLFQ